MHVTVTCSDCSRQLRLPSEVIGRSVSCPLCKATFLTRRLDDDRAEALPLPKVAARLELDDPADRGDALEVRPASAPDEILDALPADAPGRPADLPAVARFPPVRFILFVQKDPADRLDGRFQAEVDHQGLRLWRGNGRVIRVPLGAKAEHLGGARLRVEVEGRRITMLVIRGDGNAARLAADLCDFLSRKTDRVTAPSGTAWVALTCAVLPLAVPVLAGVFGNHIGGSGGIVGFGLLAVVVSAIGLLVALRSTSPLARGLVTVGGLAVVYLIFGVALALDRSATAPLVPASAWRPYAPPEGGFTVSMPGFPNTSRVPHGGFRDGSLRVHEVRLPGRPLTFTVIAGEFNDGQQLPAQMRVDGLRQYVLSTRPGQRIEREEPLWQSGFPGKQLVLQSPGRRELVRVFASDTRGFVLIAGTQMTANSPDARRFFNSFTIRDVADRFPNDKKDWKDDRKDEKKGDWKDDRKDWKGDWKDEKKDWKGWKDDKKDGKGDERAAEDDLGPWGRLLSKAPRAFAHVAIDGDGRVVAVNLDGTVTRWAVHGAQEFRTRINTLQSVVSAALSPDGRTLAAVGAGGDLFFVDMTTGVIQSVAAGLGAPTSRRRVVAFSPDGRVLAVGTASGAVQLWDAAARREGRSIPVRPGIVIRVAFAPDGLSLAAVSGRGVYLVETATGNVTGPCSTQGADAPQSLPMSGLAFSRDGRTLAGGVQRTLLLWDPATRNARRTVAHSVNLTTVAFHPAGRLVATGAADGQVRVWDAATGLERGSGLRLNPRPGLVRSLAFSRDGGRLAVAVSTGVNGRVEVWDLQRRIPLSHLDRQPLPFQPRHLTRIEVGGAPNWTSEIGPTAMSRDHSRFAFWGKDRLIRVWGSATLKAQVELAAPEVPRGLAFHPSKKLIAHGRGNTVVVYREDTEEVVTLRPANAQNVSALDYSPDGKWLATGHQGGGGTPGEVRLWDVETGKEVRRWRTHQNTVTAVTFTPDSLRVVTAGSHDPLVRLWEVATGRERLRLKGHNTEVSVLTFSPDGKTLAAGSAGGLVILYDTGRWRERFRLPVHTARVHAVAFAADGRTLATAGEDRRVRLSDVHSGRILHTLEQTAVPRGLGFSPRDTLLVRCLDGAVERWDLTKVEALKTRPAPVHPDLDRATPPEQP